MTIELFGKCIDVDGWIDEHTAVEIIQDALDHGDYDEYYTEPDIATFVETSTEEYLAGLIRYNSENMRLRRK